VGPMIAVVWLLAPQSASALDWESKTARIELASGEPRGSAHFAFTNDTANTVSITATESSCECTVVRLEKLVFAPGEKGTLPVYYSSRGNTGRRTYVIAVTTEGNDKEVDYLKLDVNTYPQISVTPRTVVWENGEERADKTVIVAIDPGSGVRLTSAAPDRDVIAVEILPQETPGRSILRLTPKAKDTIGQARVRLSTEPKVKDSAESLLFVLLR
jgi:hypothetical protein